MNQTPPLRRLLRYANPYRMRIIQACLFSILNKLADLAPPLLIGAAVDIVVQRQNSVLAQLGVANLTAQLWWLAGLTLAVWGLESVTDYINQVSWRNLAQSLEHDLRVDTYAHVQSLELAYFEDQTTGGLMSVMNDDVNQLERFLDIGADNLIQVFTTVIVIGIIFFVIAPSVAWLAFLPMPFIIWGSVWFQRFMAPRYTAVREQVGFLNAQLANNLSGIATIKSFTQEAYEVSRIEDFSDNYQGRNRWAIRLSAAFVPLIRMAIAAGFTATLVLGGRLTLEDQISVAAYSILVFMTQRLLWPLTSLGQTFDLYQRGMASTRRIFALLDTEAKMQDGETALPRAHVKGDLRLEHVHFTYNNSSTVLTDLHLHLPAGQTIGIVGATGAGKSTLIKLLLRFYDPTRGRITLDGHDLTSLRMNDLRHAIGLVSQDVFLFHGTVRENIAYGLPDATEEDIIRAARTAEAHDFIMQLPEGYDTLVGERGQKLSGGQRQRISIARAVLKNPPILILDEATSAVDNETEAAIQRSLERLAADRSMIVIAHRLSTVRNADLIYVLEQGRVIEHGKHEQLVEQQGTYARLWQVQTGSRETPLSSVN